MNRTYQSVISSDVSLATSIEEKRTDSAPSGETVRSEDSFIRSVSTSQYEAAKGDSNASSLVTVSEEMPETEDNAADMYCDGAGHVQGLLSVQPPALDSGCGSIATEHTAAIADTGSQERALLVTTIDGRRADGKTMEMPSTAHQAPAQKSMLGEVRRSSTSYDAESSALGSGNHR